MTLDRNANVLLAANTLYAEVIHLMLRKNVNMKEIPPTRVTATDEFGLVSVVLEWSEQEVTVFKRGDEAAIYQTTEMRESQTSRLLNVQGQPHKGFVAVFEPKAEATSS